MLMIGLKRKIKATDGEEPEPEFIDQIGNVTIAQGRDAILSCSVAHLNDYTVRTCRTFISSSDKARVRTVSN
jgi:hypothetical protein